ncbi:hypothetical protein [Sporomusa termitida]|uniref:Uncharacterized protein n=1 Tax=Sporomusa termitida TaxID=2377 RepID=A0A517DRU9_9FIRM|nr:hypothetical protein [Sporomusa termitida]QDR80016.1 hypothetical protein SPTER_13250 [Sporomusa termitida]
MVNQRRRCDRQAAVADSVSMLAKCEGGVLATVNQDRVPYGVTFSYILKIVIKYMAGKVRL